MTINSIDVLLFLFGISLLFHVQFELFLSDLHTDFSTGQVVWYSHLFQNFSQFVMIHTVKGLGRVNKVEVDIFLELSCFFDDPANVDNLYLLLDIYQHLCLLLNSLFFCQCPIQWFFLTLQINFNFNGNMLYFCIFN